MAEKIDTLKDGTPVYIREGDPEAVAAAAYLAAIQVGMVDRKLAEEMMKIIPEWEGSE